MVVEYRVDLPRSTKWHETAGPVENGYQTRYLAGFGCLDFQVLNGRLHMGGYAYLIKTRRRFKEHVSGLPERLQHKVLWQVRALSMIDLDADMTQYLITSALKQDLILLPGPLDVIMTGARHELLSIRDKWSGEIFRRPQLVRTA
jgi:hypothetical protein